MDTSTRSRSIARSSKLNSPAESANTSSVDQRKKSVQLRRPFSLMSSDRSETTQQSHLANHTFAETLKKNQLIYEMGQKKPVRRDSVKTADGTDSQAKLGNQPGSDSDLA